MCGFTIIVSKNKLKFPNRKTLNHRGPDSFKYIKFKNILFQHWRLAIVDLSEKAINQ